MTLGRRAVIRTLLSGRLIIMDGDWSIFLRIWVEDYIVWVQGASDRVLKVLGEEMRKVMVEAGEIGFDLEVDSV